MKHIESMIANEGSPGKAARALEITTSTFSAKLRQDIKIMEIVNGTNHGYWYYAYAKTSFDRRERVGRLKEAHSNYLANSTREKIRKLPSSLVTIKLFLTNNEEEIEFDLFMYPVVGDNIPIMMDDEPMPDWIRCSAETWHLINPNSIVIKSRDINNEGVYYTGRLWK